jgi:AAA15 family ATPase/GTPase
MLIEFRVQNFRSFNTEQTLSLSTSSSTKENYNEENTIELNKFGINKLVKSAAIFGANASGKTNLATALDTLKYIVLFSLKSIDIDNIPHALPFFIKDNFYDIPTEFELSFISDGKMYRYGLSIKNKLISEEWLYQTITSRETMLFHRTQQKIEFNKRSFSEAENFVSKSENGYSIEQTKNNIPFISVISQFKGKVSSEITGWFKKLNIASGITDDGVKSFTIDLFQQDKKFKAWALNILKSLQIEDILIVEEDETPPNTPKNKQFALEIATKVGAFLKTNPSKNKKIKVAKELNGKNFLFPIDLESEGTRKIIYILGPLYDTIKKNKVLFIDEFDSKLHSLLSEFIIKLFHKESSEKSQLIITCHDTNLLNKSIFRRDQIWFIQKNQNHESELFSLVEYKEYYTRKDNNYSKDYLEGKYGAIPLFSSLENFNEVCNG